ncbi:MAG: ATP-binding protein [Chitinophagales bacterium]
MKNASPRWVAITAALTVSAVLFLLECVTIFVQRPAFPLLGLILIPILAGGLSFLVFYFLLEKFIYRKIKLIYKNIHALKSTKIVVDEKMDMSKDVISEVGQEVMQWAKERNREIDQLVKQADFRKEFLGNVSHELKTPIMSIQGYLEILLDNDTKDVYSNKMYLEKALRNVDRMILMIDDLVNISKLESGEIELQYTRFDICALTKEVYESLEIQADQRQILLDIKEDCDHPFMVYADLKRIREVLVNLISNAIKYGRETGSVHAGFYRMGDQVLIEIADNGIGIDKEDLNRVFERFYRIDKSRSRDMGGTGLGLSIVKHIVEAHGQTVHVRSTPGVGSTFGFTLSAAR